MALTRKLSDLYVKGKEVTIDDGNGAVEVYLQKVMPVDSEAAFRAANAAKSRALSLRTDPDSVMFQYIQSRCEEATKDQMVDQLAELEVARKRRVIEAELEAEDKWAKDDYLQGLLDSWETGLKEKYFAGDDEKDDNNNPVDKEEATRVFKEIEKFNTELEKRVKREKEAAVKDLTSMAHTKIKDRFFDALMEQQAEISWFKEYRRQELYFAVRDPEDHTEKAFESPDEVDQMAPELIEKLADEYASISIDAIEGKG